MSSSKPQTLQQSISLVSNGISTKVDNSEFQGLKAIVTQLQKDVVDNTHALYDLKVEAGKQTQQLTNILQLLRTPPLPFFTEDDRLALDMVAEFGTMAIVRSSRI
ncbi:hypothetical protein L6452_01878 [Arctium lappa]|uniref:Uncharacterized protein n=1 Tax=Arctium lappa TaxID=4217 RepID=A0ACB9FIP0_ARCLA|nr:hypothetical protein L6452_01878 [Arctium lappa]